MKRLLATSILSALLAPSLVQAAALPGHVDTSFGEDGRRSIAASLPAGSARGPATVLAGPAGALYVIGYTDRPDATSAITIARLDANGDIDTSFGTAGVVEHLPDGLEAAYAFGATFDPQGRLLVVGQAVAGSGHMLLCRFDAAGAIDTSFGKPATPGCAVEVIDQQSVARAVLVQTCDLSDECNGSNHIIVAGSIVDANSKRRGMVAAFSESGKERHTAFGDQGVVKVTGAMTANSTGFDALAQNATGALVAVGSERYGPADYDFSIFRLRPDGELETGFDLDGYRTLAFDLKNADHQSQDHATSAYLGDDEAVLVAGYAQYGAQSFRPAAVKFDSGGGEDFSFVGGVPDDDGGYIYDICAEPCDARFNAMRVLPDGRILLAGSIARGDEDDLELTGKNDMLAMRLLPDGTPDPTFRSADGTQDGVATVDHGAVAGNSDDVGTSLALQGDRMVIAGYARAADPDPDDDVWDDYDFALTRLGAGDALFSDGFE